VVTPSPVLRDALARYLGRSRGVLADPERIVICGGYTQALAVLAKVLHGRDVGEIAFEDPSFPLFRQLAEASGPRVVGVPVDPDGLRVSGLDSPAVVVTAAHQYPLSVTLAPAKRAALTKWATDSGAVVIEDDYDGEFRFDRQQVGALQALAPESVYTPVRPAKRWHRHCDLLGWCSPARWWTRSARRWRRPGFARRSWSS
jgi:GntR family transcriptional regulator/MocR family aminotransferase